MFRALHLEENKKIIQPAIFGFSRWLPFEGEKRNLSKWFSFDLSQCLPDGREILKPFIKTAFSCSTTWGRKLLTAKARFLVILVAYLLRKEKIFKRLNFRFFSWSTPWGRKFRSRHNFWPLQVGTSEEIYTTEVKNGFLAGSSLGGYLKTTQKGPSPRGYVKKLWIFRKTPTKTASLSRNKWKANFREDPKKHHLSFLT